MNSPFDPNRGTWKMDWPGRVARYDLVFQTPPSDPMQGIPIGNGEIGVLAWCEGSKLICVINKSDLWDDAKFGQFHNWWSQEEEFSTTLRHGCRIILDFKMPVFNVFYLKDFTGRLSLADASLQVEAAGPFGSVSVRGFVDHKTGVFVVEGQSKLKENVPVEIQVERFGSRTFSHWYSLVNRDPNLGLQGTKAVTDKNSAYITHKLTSGTFAAGCRIIETNSLKAQCTTEHSHRAKIVLSGSPAKKFSLIAGITSPESNDSIKTLKKEFEMVRKKGKNAIFAEHKQAWKEFWMRSLMEFGDDYLDGLWHVTMFYAACSQRGKYPGRFINGLWSWNRDVQNWNFYFHWNQQQVYWPLNTAGHHDLVDSYLNYRFNALPYGQQDARNAFKTDGAVVSDVCERRGYNSANEFHNHTPAAQIAMEFWRQYKYTGDLEFLQTRALPYLLNAARFFESLFEKEKDGKYHAREGTAYEGWILLHDCVSELVYARVLFTTVLEALKEAGVEEPRSDKWREILNNLAPLPTIKMGKGFIKKGKLDRGLFKGDAVCSEKMLAAGYGVKEKKLLTSFLPKDSHELSAVDIAEIIHMQEGKPPIPDKPKDDLRCYDGVFPWVENSAVFPSGLVGLADKGTDIYNVTVNTVKIFAQVGMGWFPLAATLARLGLAREARRALDIFPIFWQFYCNGWGHYGPMPVMKAEISLPFKYNSVRDASLPFEEQEKKKFNFALWPFRHMGMEAMSVLTTAMNEILLQSHDGVIRVGPAVVENQNARFTLHAQDGFEVSTEIEKGLPMWISIKSKFGKNCRITNPWSKAVVFENGKKILEAKTGTIEFPTVTGKVYMIVPNEKVLNNWKTVPASHAKNEQAKIHSSQYATLGLPRMF